MCFVLMTRVHNFAWHRLKMSHVPMISRSQLWRVVKTRVSVKPGRRLDHVLTQQQVTFEKLTDLLKALKDHDSTLSQANGIHVKSGEKFPVADPVGGSVSDLIFFSKIK